jgi:predicted amidophosphoribosyltransferase
MNDMANPLFNTFGNNNQFTELMKQAQDFKKQFSDINPRAEVERLLNSGEMSQQQFNQYSQIAQQVAQMMGRN